jgi:L-fucose isomerase-like protein
MDKIRLGFIPSHRYPFDEEWAVEMRRRTIDTLGAVPGVEIVVPSVGLIHNGLVRDDTGARATIDLFAQRGVQGIIIGTMTFGDEVSAVSIAEALDVPVLVFGTKEGPFTSDGGRRSDAFCGTLAITSGLYRRKIPYLFAGIVWPEEPSVAHAVWIFARACAAVDAFYGARIGMVGLRPERSEACTFSESALIQHFRQRVVQIPESEVVAAADAWPEEDHRLIATLEEMRREADCGACSQVALTKMARLELVLQRYFQERDLSAMAMSCGDGTQARGDEPPAGICACHTLRRLAGKGMMVACQVDVLGALTMLTQYRASLEAAVPHFIDWAIQHQEMEDVFLAWHCGNAPAALTDGTTPPTARESVIVSRAAGNEKAQGAGESQLDPGPVTLSRLVEYDGAFKMLIASGEIIPSGDRPGGTSAWVRVGDLSRLYRVLAEQGFAHHASMIHGDAADALEAFCRFTGIEVVRV